MTYRRRLVRCAFCDRLRPDVDTWIDSAGQRRCLTGQAQCLALVGHRDPA